MRRVYKKIKRFLISSSILIAVNFFYFFPLRFYKLLSLFLYFSLSKFRKIGLENIKILRLNKKILWKNFSFMTKGFLKFIKLGRVNKNELLKNVRVEGEEIFNEKMKKGKGVLVYTLHMGFWEIIPAYFSSKGFPVCVLASKVYTDLLNNYVNSIRKRFGTDVIHPDNTISLIKKLKRGYAVGILMDQKQGSKRISVKFFGRDVEAPVGPLEIAYRVKPEVILMRCEEDGSGDKIFIEPFELSYDLEKDLQRIYNKFEEWIKRKPEEWVWIHKRF